MMKRPPPRIEQVGDNDQGFSDLRLELFLLSLQLLLGGGKGFDFLRHVDIFRLQIVLGLFQRSPEVRTRRLIKTGTTLIDG